MQPKDEEIKVRVPSAIKSAIQEIAASRFTSESEIARQALIEYLGKHSSTFAESQKLPAVPPAKPVTYKNSSRKAKKARYET